MDTKDKMWHLGDQLNDWKCMIDCLSIWKKWFEITVTTFWIINIALCSAELFKKKKEIAMGDIYR